MRIIKPLLLIVAMASIAACVDSRNHKATAQQRSQAITVEMVHAAAQCGRSETGASAHWIGNATQLESFYRQLNLAPVELDFSQSAVVLVKMGQRPTLGYRLALANAEAQTVDDHLVVVLEWREPPKDMMVGQMLTSPCLLLKLERGDYREVWIKDTQGQRRAIAAIP